MALMSNLKTIKVSLLEAIARQEGWLNENSLCRKNHNPGNIIYGHFAIHNGAIGQNGRFAVFPNDEIGFAALSTLLSGPEYANLSIELAIHKYAPSVENDTAAYIKNICEWSGNSPNTIINTLRPLTFERYVQIFRPVKNNPSSVQAITNTNREAITNKEAEKKV